MELIYELVGEKIRQVFDSEVVDIVTFDPNTNLMTMRYSYEKGDRSTFTPREPFGFRLHVIQTRAPLLLNRITPELNEQYGNPILIGDFTNAALFVPMLVGGQARGVISLQNLD